MPNQEQDSKRVEAFEASRQYFPWAKKDVNSELSFLDNLVGKFTPDAFIVSTQILTPEDDATGSVLTIVLTPRTEEHQPAKASLSLIRMNLVGGQISKREGHVLSQVADLFGLQKDSLGYVIREKIESISPNPVARRVENLVVASSDTQETQQNAPVIDYIKMGVDDSAQMRALRTSLAEMAVDARQNLNPLVQAHLAMDRLAVAGFDTSKFSHDPKTRMIQIFELMLVAKEKMVDLERIDVQLNELHVKQQERQVSLGVLRAVELAAGNFFLRSFAPPEAKTALKAIVDASAFNIIQNLFSGKTPDEIISMMGKGDLIRANTLIAQARAEATALVEKSKGEAAQDFERTKGEIESRKLASIAKVERADEWMELIQERFGTAVDGVKDFFVDPNTGIVIKLANLLGVIHRNIRTAEGVGFVTGGTTGLVLGVGAEAILLSKLTELTILSGNSGNLIVMALTLTGGLGGSYLASKYSKEAHPAQPSHKPEQASQPVTRTESQAVLRPASQINRPVNSSNNLPRPAPKPAPSRTPGYIPPEPTYHPVSNQGRDKGSEHTSHYDI